MGLGIFITSRFVCSAQHYSSTLTAANASLAEERGEAQVGDYLFRENGSKDNSTGDELDGIWSFR
jgi:hypothetical protein